MTSADLPITLVPYGQPYQYKVAKTEWVAFIGPDTSQTEKYYSDLFQVYLDRPTYRKLGMVASVTSTPMSAIYGWTMHDDRVLPKYTASSQAPYAIQIGNILGSIIRTNALKKLEYKFTGVVYRDSVQLSVALWEDGQHILLDPGIIGRGENNLDMAVRYDGASHPDIQKLFKRECVG